MTELGTSGVTVEDVFEYLDVLRVSGVTNMYDAAPYIEHKFNLSKTQARRTLVAWIETFGDGTRSAAVRAKGVTI